MSLDSQDPIVHDLSPEALSFVSGGDGGVTFCISPIKMYARTTDGSCLHIREYQIHLLDGSTIVTVTW